MKYILFIALFSPLLLAAQDCKLNREKDPFTKEIKLSTGFIGMNGGSVTIDANSTEIDFLFSIEGVDRCFDNNSMAAVFFEGTKLKMTNRNGGSMNCEGLFHFIFRNTATTTSLLSRMINQKINHFVFTCTSKKDVTVTLSPSDQQALMDQTKCLVDEAKALIK
jgi:hypothetical protein